MKVLLVFSLSLCTLSFNYVEVQKQPKKVKKVSLNRKETRVTIIYTDNSKKYY